MPITINGSGTITGATTMASTSSFATTIGVGAATPSASGAGITFPATQSASSDANTLDDYEEGTWTPAFVNIGTGTYTTQFGRYTKVGRLVTIECYVVIASLGSASGAMTLSGLPFTCSITSTTPQMWTNNWSSSGQNIVALTNGGTQLDFYSIPTSGGVTAMPMSNLANNANLVFNFSYSVG